MCFAVFARACKEEEFELAEHLLCAGEVIARQQDACWQLDAAYEHLAQSVDRPQSDTREGTQ